MPRYNLFLIDAMHHCELVSPETFLAFDQRNYLFVCARLTIQCGEHLEIEGQCCLVLVGEHLLKDCDRLLNDVELKADIAWHADADFFLDSVGKGVRADQVRA